MSNHPYTELKKYIIKSGLDNMIDDELLPFLELKQYEKKEVIMYSGDDLSYVYIILEGKVSINSFSEEGKVVLISNHEKMGLLGELEYFHNCTYLHTVMALTPTKVLAIPIEIIDSHLSKNATFLKFMCITLTEKLMTSSINYARARLYPVKNKLCKYILQSMELQETSTITFVSKNVSQELGVSDRHLRRILSELTQEHVLTKEGKNLTIIDKGKLKEYSSYF